MDCDCNQRSTCPPRPRVQNPPCMNTNCDRNAERIPEVMPGTMPGTMPGMMPGTMPGTMPGMMPETMPGTMSEAWNRSGRDGLRGMPIAMGYVPWQQWSQTYPLEQGLIRGTIFPELDLPFVMGRCRG